MGDPALPPADAVERFRADLHDILGEPRPPLGLAVSGGPDSLALLLLASAAYPGRVRAATVDHKLRPDSAAEAAFVGEVCAQLDVAHSVLAPQWEQPPSSNIQAVARGARYSALSEWAAAEAGGVFLTAHHLDDQAETLLLRLARGAGLGGLSGIRPGPFYQGKGASGRIARPLLGWRRSELAGIVAAAGLKAIDDPSNSAERYDRTHARRLLAEVPWLEPERLAASADHLGQAEDALAWMSERIWDERGHRGEDGIVSVDPRDVPAELRRRLLLRALGHFTDQSAIPGPKLSRLLGELQRGKSGTIAGVLVRSGPRWTFSPAPPRRATR